VVRVTVICALLANKIEKVIDVISHVPQAGQSNASDRHLMQETWVVWGTLASLRRHTSRNVELTVRRHRRTWARVVLSMLKRREAGGLGGSSLPMAP
jgi:hypothetical protein